MEALCVFKIRILFLAGKLGITWGTPPFLNCLYLDNLLAYSATIAMNKLQQLL